MTEPLVLAIDPGRAKCGLVLASPGGPSGRAKVHLREIVPTERLVARVLQLLGEWEPSTVLVGDGTHGAPLARALRDALPERLRLERVPEAYTSQRARERLARESLPRGINRFLPPGMRTPPRPYDDYVAAILAEDWFAAHPGASPDA